MNAVIYARYSSHSQTEQSIEGQLRDAYDYAKRENITIVGEYIDRAQSGRTDHRTDFQRMLQDAAKEQFQLVIVWKLDRFARNRYDSAIHKAKLKKHGVRVISIKENITDSPEGIILEGLLESMAEYYSANLSQNIRRGQRESIAKGQYCGGQIPRGYKSVNKRFVVVESEMKHFLYAAEQLLSGSSITEIVQAMRARGVKGSRGGEMTYNSVYNMLKNPAYAGMYTYRGEVVPDVAPAVITVEQHNRIRQILQASAKAPGAAKAVVDYLLQGKAFCGYCGSSMIGESGRGRLGATYRYYTCAQRKKHHTCHKKNEKKDIAERYVVEQTVRYVLAPRRAASIAKAVVAEYNKDFSAEKTAALEREIKRIDRELNKLVDALIEAPKSAHARIYEKMESLEAEKSELDTDLAKLRIAQGIRLTEEEVLAWLKSFCTGTPDDENFRRHIIDVFVNSVYFFDDRLAIFYNLRNNKQVSHENLTEALESLSCPLGSDFTPNGVRGDNAV